MGKALALFSLASPALNLSGTARAQDRGFDQLERRRSRVFIRANDNPAWLSKPGVDAFNVLSSTNIQDYIETPLRLRSLGG